MGLDERSKRILEMRFERTMALEEIGAEFGISGRRVYQIIKEISAKHGIEFPRLRVDGLRTAARRRNGLTMHSKCMVCDTRIEVLQGARRRFCEAHKRVSLPSVRFARLCPNWLEMSEKERRLWRYKNDPEYRERRRASVYKCLRKIRSDPDFRRKSREYQKQYVARRLAENPNFYKEKALRERERVARRLAEARARLEEAGIIPREQKN